MEPCPRAAHPVCDDFQGVQELAELCRQAADLRDHGKGRTVSFSPKVFIPLTQLCRNACGYCVFREEPGSCEAPFLSPGEVLALARAGEAAGCREALFVLGECPEQRYPEARDWLQGQGCESSLEYLHRCCALVLAETRLYPHSNAGLMTISEMRALREVNVSLGLMLETTSPRLSGPAGPHGRSPGKDPDRRLEMLEAAGRLGIPFTTGLLIGIGESLEERTADLRLLAGLHSRYGHLQEIIIQNFRPKGGTAMEAQSPPGRAEMLETLARARIILGPGANIQAPPNLAAFGENAYMDYLSAGINDWGGISPVTADFINPEAPWPHIDLLRKQNLLQGFRLRARFPVYPEYILGESDFLPPSLKKRLRQESDSSGFIPDSSFRPVFNPGENTDG
jgi:FO synthase